MPDSVIPDSVVPDSTFACYAQFRCARFPQTAELSDHENWKELLEEANGVKGQHEDLTWTWIVGLYSRSVIVTVFDRGKSPQEDTGRSPREDFDMTKHDMTNCCLVGWREG